MEKLANGIKKIAPNFIVSLGVLVSSFAVATFLDAGYGIVAAHILSLSLYDKGVSYLEGRIK